MTGSLTGGNGLRDLVRGDLDTVLGHHVHFQLVLPLGLVAAQAAGEAGLAVDEEALVTLVPRHVVLALVAPPAEVAAELKRLIVQALPRVWVRDVHFQLE